ncbi:MAG TPA: hypothetical protein VGN98_00705 [Tianweitania sediminis]|nr:hypothetical protein [Tianweitania sediminis]
MTKKPAHTFTPETLKTFDKKKVETIRDNAVRLGADDLVAMCEEDLAARAPVARARSSSSSSTRRVSAGGSASRTGDVVGGYHFVCEKDHGVIDLGDGRFWSGTWTVSDADVDKSLDAGAYLALHETKSQPSYRQGKIVGYRKAPGDDEGVEFLVESQPKARAWVGAGSGDKGYKWVRQ